MVLKPTDKPGTQTLTELRRMFVYQHPGSVCRRRREISETNPLQTFSLLLVLAHILLRRGSLPLFAYGRQALHKLGPELQLKLEAIYVEKIK